MNKKQILRLIMIKDLHSIEQIFLTNNKKNSCILL